MNPDEINVDAQEIEKDSIAEVQELQQEEIIELDEAAGSAEGLSNREEDLFADVAEDRDATPPEALDISESEIVA